MLFEQSSDGTKLDHLWPGRLQAALHARHGGYRVLCSGDTEWDAVEGAARTLTSSAALAAQVVDANALLKKQRGLDEKTM